MPRGTLEFILDLGDPGRDTMYLAFSLGAGGGPFEFAIFPSDRLGTPKPYRLLGTKAGEKGILDKLAEALRIDALKGVARLSNEGIWAGVFNVEILPELRVSPTGANPSLQAVLKVFHGNRYGLTIGADPITLGGMTIQIEPQITVYELELGYTPATGLRLNAVVDYGEVGAKAKEDGATAMEGVEQARGAGAEEKEGDDQATPAIPGGQHRPPMSAQKVAYPFPMPATKEKAAFCVHYFGLGQRFGSDVDLNAPNPIGTALKRLEDELTSSTPAEVLPMLAQHYHPDRDWFIAAHISMRGWDLRAIFNDPALYGMEITSTQGSFKGLDFQILYQQGVYYGAITLPATWRTIQLGAASLTLPSFKVWIHNNGDFRFEAGWPLGNDSFGAQVAIYTGRAGLYFAKLRSGGAVPAYNPILAFGLALELGLGRSFTAGPLSASLLVGFRGVFQGVLAWKANDQGRPRSLSSPPDYYWFSASVSLVGVVKGSVNLRVVSVSFSVDIIVTARVAFETNCGSIVRVNAHVAVSVRVKIVFVRITLSFHTTVSAEFQLSGGQNVADPDSPTNQDFKSALPSGRAPALAALRAPGMAALSETQRARTTAMIALSERLLSAATPPAVALHFLLYPAVDYTQPGGPELQAVGGLIIEKDQFPTFLTAVAGWLMATFGGPDLSWDAILGALGGGNEPAPPNFRDGITSFLSTGRFTINGVDLTAQHDVMDAYLFAMPPVLALSGVDLPAPRDFAEYGKTPAGYRDLVKAYFGALARLSGNAPEDSGHDDGRTRAESVSMADVVFYDYLVLVCRQLAHEMVAAQVTEPTEEMARQVGGVASRYLLHGLRLPKPNARRPAPGQIWDEDDLAGLYTLTGQQFPIKPAEGKEAISATLSVSPNGGILARAFTFAPGPAAEVPASTLRSVTSALPLPAVPPPAPDPGWNQAGSQAAPTQRSGIVAAALWLGVNNRVQWTHTDGRRSPTTQGLAQLPAPIPNPAHVDPVKLKIYREPQPSADATEYPFVYALRIPLNIFTIARRRDVDATWSEPAEGANAAGSPTANETESEGSFSPADTELRDIYRFEGVDDADRDRLGEIITALGRPDPQNLRLHVLLPASGQPAFTSDDDDEAAAWFVKTNLTTTSVPGPDTAAMETLVARAMAAKGRPHPLTGRAMTAGAASDRMDEIGPVAARITDVSAVLQLLYEASIVHGGGFFLSWPGRDGKGLPTALFKDGRAELELLIVMPDATSVQEKIHNALVIQGETAATVYLLVTDGNGNPRPDFHSSLPQGSLGFEMDWTQSRDGAASRPDDPFDPSVIHNLYHLLQFRIDGSAPGSGYDTSVWSGSLGPMTDGQAAPAAARPAAPTDEEPGAPQTYRASPPIWKFVKGVNPADPAQALAGIGQDAALDFRLVDVFGNVLTGNAYSTRFRQLYDDPLVPPATWPGAHLDYSIDGDGKSDPTLNVRLSFKADRQWRPAQDGTPPDLSHLILRYQQIVAQVADSNLTVALATELVTRALMAADARAGLQRFATSALAYLQALAAGQKPPAVAPALITTALVRSEVANLPDNIFRLTVDLTLARPTGRVDPMARRQLPAVESVTTHVLPRIEGMGDRSPLSLKGFARIFETAYAGFDGEQASKLKLALRAEKTNRPNQAGPVGLWAVRLSAKSGIALAVPDVKPVSFTMAPMSTELVSGRVRVTTYDAGLQPVEAFETFNGIALDDWMRSFLLAMDSLLSPGSAPVLARLPARHGRRSTPYERLMAAKAVLARGLAGRVVPVFRPAAGSATEWPGELAAAQDKFEQSLLEYLSRAYTISVILQTQIEVSAVGQAAENATVPPRFYGTLPPHAPPANAGVPPPDSAFTISSAILALPEGEASAQQALTWVISVRHPADDAFLDLNRDYNIGFMEHYINLDADGKPVLDPDEPYGYVPSSWLRFVVTEDPAHPGRPDPVLNYALPAVRAPIPLHEFPPTPRIASQKAAGHRPKAEPGVPIDEIIKEALQWDYALTVAESEFAHEQDNLWLTLSYNLPASAATVAGDAAPDPLFTALARFTTAYQSLSALLPQLQVGAAATPHLSDLAEILAGLAEEVSNTFLPPTGTQGVAGGAPQSLTDIYVVEFLHAQDAPCKTEQTEPYLTVSAKVASAADTVIWPTIDGLGGPTDVTGPVRGYGLMEGLWKRAKYDGYAAPGDGKLPQILLTWEGLDIRERQTVRPQVKVVRNADLAEYAPGMTTNPRLIYGTPPVTASRLVPYTQVAQVIDMPADGGLPASLQRILAPFLAAGTPSGTPLTFQVRVGYEYALSTDRQGNPLVATDTILLVDGLELGDQPSLDEFVRRVNDQIVAWMKELNTNQDLTRWITLSINAFANLNETELPLLSLSRVRIRLE